MGNGNIIKFDMRNNSKKNKKTLDVKSLLSLLRVGPYLNVMGLIQSCSVLCQIIFV